MSSESYNTRHGRMRQGIHNFKNDFSTIETLKAKNLILKLRVDSLKEKITELNISRNKLDQYTRKNNIEIQGTPATVSDDHLEDKVLDNNNVNNMTSIILQRLITIPIMTKVIIRIKIMLVIPKQAVKKSLKIGIIIKTRRMKNHRKNENGNKKRKKHRRIKTPGKEKENQAYV